MKGLFRSLKASPATQAIVKQTFKLRALSCTVTGATGVGYGSAVLGDFPAGNILLLGAVGYFTVTKTTANITATFDGDVAVGTTATADATLSGTDVNVLPSTALGAATAGVSPTVRATNATAAVLDNTDGSLELNLQVLVDDADIDAAAQNVTVTGEVYLSYVVLGDD